MLAFLPGMPGWIEVVIFGAIILLLFGNRMPGAMRALGRSIVSFKEGTKEAEKEITDDTDGSNS